MTRYLHKDLDPGRDECRGVCLIAAVSGPLAFP